MKACPRSSHHSAERKFHPGLVLHWCSFSDWSANYGALLFKNRTKIISRQTSVRPVSEYLTPGTKTVIQYDCMPSFANILLASITDIDKNRIVESFGIKKGIKLENTLNYTTRRWIIGMSYSSSQKDNSYAVIRHERGFYYVQRRKSLSANSAIQQKLKNDLRKTRKNNAIYRKMVSGTGQHF